LHKNVDIEGIINSVEQSNSPRRNQPNKTLTPDLITHLDTRQSKHLSPQKKWHEHKLAVIKEDGNERPDTEDNGHKNNNSERILNVQKLENDCFNS